MFSCIYVCAFMYIWMHMCTHRFTLDIYMWIKDRRAIPVLFLRCLPPLISHKISQCPGTSPSRLDWLSRTSRDLPISASHFILAGITCVVPHPALICFLRPGCVACASFKLITHWLQPSRCWDCRPAPPAQTLLKQFLGVG